MCAVAFPQPKPSSMRPPIVPPSITGFGQADGEPDPIDRMLVENALHLVKQVRTADPDSYPLLLRLIDQRKQMLNVELSLARMIAPEPMPPLLTNFYSLDNLGDEDNVVQTYVRVLSELDEAEKFIRAQFVEINLEAPASDQ